MEIILPPSFKKYSYRVGYLSVVIIVLPQRSDLMKTSDIPNGKFYVFIFQLFYIESDCWYSLDKLILFELE